MHIYALFECRDFEKGKPKKTEEVLSSSISVDKEFELPRKEK